MEPISAARIPRHVAIIMDGNGRWAAQRGLPRLAGHDAGTENIRRITFKAGELGIRYLTLWAFSTENWRRPPDEVQGIMQILARAIESETQELHRQGAQLRHIGDLSALDPELQQAVRDAIELTRDNDRLVLTLAFNYGGRQELIHAIQQIIADGAQPGQVDEALVDQYLYTAGTPDPDLVIRTSGECRMSNFLLWQASYAELYFSSVLWPDFGPDELEAAVREFGKRERRFGHISAAALTAE
ncbi:MAG TPA: polyprenyl diphosphate synthase [Thermomicrobiales bacterium]|jgi:undecaprenyl diphosphate synthase|nr:polyprenyl diphosphate synthase [Thermomicrobiales bacterium]